MNRDELLALADRCGAETKPSRELDGAIDRLFNERPKHGDYDHAEGALWQVKDGWSGLLVRGDGFARGSFSAANYTSSIDAAVKLVPDAMTWSVDEGPSHWILAGTSEPAGRAQVYRQADYINEVTGDPAQVSEHGFGATPALALCAAALRAKASQ